MATSAGPKVNRDNLIFSIDGSASVRGYSRVGTSGPSNSSNAIRDLISKVDMDLQNMSYIGGANLFTLYGITYPESSYTPASRDGITPGFNNTSAGKTYDCSRALNYFVYDEDGGAWVPDSFFTGLRINGHCYDNYAGYASYSDELAKFENDYYNIQTVYPNATHILIGSHACDVYDTALKKIMMDLGGPLDIESWNNSRREWVLVGKPGLGAGYAYGWAYENEQSGAVAHLNSAIPYENPSGYLNFDGTNDYIDIPDSQAMLEGSDDFTIEAYYTITGSAGGELFGNYGTGNTTDSIWFSGQYGIFINGGVYASGHPITSGTHHMVATREGGAVKLYLDGALSNSGTLNVSITNNGQLYRIGADVNGAGEPFSGSLYVLRVYKRALTETEVIRSYNTLKQRG